MEAVHYHPEGELIRCTLCPHQCLIREGRDGICRVRRNEGGILMAGAYGSLSSIHLDPVEKKPLYHFYPGRNIFSIGSWGCNMHCACCQNWQISQVFGQEGRVYSPVDIVRMARQQRNNIGVAYTYNEPVVWFEFMTDTAQLVHAEGMKNVMVSNGFLSEEPLSELVNLVDAFNIDLKAFSEEAYKRHTGASLQPVLDNLIRIRQTGRHLEITSLVVPGVNDNEDEFRKMVSWIRTNLGKDTILHLSRYHPMYRMKEASTPADLLRVFHAIASEELHYVYLGNLMADDLQDTRCGNCGEKVILRRGFDVDLELSLHGTCRNCGNHVATME